MTTFAYHNLEMAFMSEPLLFADSSYQSTHVLQAHDDDDDDYYYFCSFPGEIALMLMPRLLHSSTLWPCLILGPKGLTAGSRKQKWK